MGANFVVKVLKSIKVILASLIILRRTLRLKSNVRAKIQVNLNNENFFESLLIVIKIEMVK